ncbi:MAG: hypothetical protein AAFP84_16115 [Actinomycetota bacterium]
MQWLTFTAKKSEICAQPIAGQGLLVALEAQLALLNGSECAVDVAEVHGRSRSQKDVVDVSESGRRSYHNHLRETVPQGSCVVEAVLRDGHSPLCSVYCLRHVARTSDLARVIEPPEPQQKVDGKQPRAVRSLSRAEFVDELTQQLFCQAAVVRCVSPAGEQHLAVERWLVDRVTADDALCRLRAIEREASSSHHLRTQRVASGDQYAAEPVRLRVATDRAGDESDVLHVSRTEVTSREVGGR